MSQYSFSGRKNPFFVFRILLEIFSISFESLTLMFSDKKCSFAGFISELRYSTDLSLYESVCFYKN